MFWMRAAWFGLNFGPLVWNASEAYVDKCMKSYRDANTRFTLKLETLGNSSSLLLIGDSLLHSSKLTRKRTEFRWGRR